MKTLFLITLVLLSYIGYSQPTKKPFPGLPDFVYGAYMSRLAGDVDKMLILKVDGSIDTLTIPTGGGGSSTYNGASPATVTIGGYSSGDAISGSYDDIIEKLLTPFQEPTFSSFSIPSQTTSLEVGATISGSKNFAWVFTNGVNVGANTMDVYDVTNTTYLVSNVTTISPFSVAIGSIQKTTSSSHSWRGEATDTEGNTFQSSNFTVNWYWKRYWGFDTNGTLTSAELNGGNNELTTAYTKNFTTGSPSGNQYLYFAYPSSFGDVNEIYVSGFPSIDAFTKSVQSHTNTLGVVVNYNVYISNNTFNTSSVISIQ